MSKRALIVLALFASLTVLAACAPTPTSTPMPSPTAVDSAAVVNGSLIVTHTASGSFTAIPIGEPASANTSDGWKVFRESSGNPTIIIKNAAKPERVLIVNSTTVEKQYKTVQGEATQRASSSVEVSVAVKGELKTLGFKGLGTDQPMYVR